jgi:hypothetical protein
MDFNASSFWDVLLWSFFFFIWIAFIFIWVRCVFDLFGDPEVGTFAKVVWAICFIFFGPLTTLVYLLARGRSMTERQRQAAAAAQARQQQYIKEAAGTAGAGGVSPAQQIGHAKELLDSGAITQAEFDALKAKVLA